MTVCYGGGKDHVTSHSQFFHNSQFYVLFYILSYILNINSSCKYHLGSCKKLNLYCSVTDRHSCMLVPRYIKGVILTLHYSNFLLNLLEYLF